MTLQVERPADEPVPDSGPPPNYNLALIAAAAVLIAILVGLAAYLAFRNDDGGFEVADSTTTSVDEPTTEPPADTSPDTTTGTTAATSTTGSATSTATSATSSSAPTSTTIGSTTTAPSPVSQPVVWPDPGRSSGFDSPEAAARSFASDLAGFADPILGEFMAGDGRSGELEIQPSAAGPVTTVLLRQVGADDSWWVIGAVSTDIVIDQPTTGQAISGSFRLTGEARAFEGTVEVDVFAHGRTDPILSGFVTGRGDGELGSYDETFDVPTGVSGPGLLLLTSSSAEDGSAWTVAAIPVLIG